MSGSNIKYDYHAVDTSTLTFKNIVTQCEDTNNQLIALKNQLDACFTGTGADAWQQTIMQMINKAAAYNSALENLKKVVQSVGGGGGIMNTTDKANAGRFLAIDV